MVELLSSTDLGICAHAIRTCHASYDRSDDGGPKDLALINNVANKRNKHKSTIEHIVYSFKISNMSRAVLQELARHRIASLSVKSTRYTLKELHKIDLIKSDDMETVGKYCKLTGVKEVDKVIAEALVKLQGLLLLDIPIDKVKYALPDAYLTELVWTSNARSLQNLLTLRLDKATLWEFRELAREIYEALPESHKYLYEECLPENKVTTT